jgi:asparagine synthase (glutamine-hydrolysing)
LDSSIVTALCASELTQPLATFSLDYANNDKYFVPEKFQPTSDKAFIDLMQTRLQTDHHWTVLTPEDLEAALEDATCARDLPGMGDVDFSLLCFCKDISSTVKVALSGECADELFGGYPWYRDPQIRALQGFPWAQNTAARANLISPYYLQKLQPQSFVMDRYNDTVVQCDILPGTAPEEKRMKEMMNLNYKWFMQTLIDRNDRMSMYAGLEVRVPYCDRRIAQYLYNVPWAFKDYEGREKGLLRKAAEGLLPEEILYRKKSPFPKTYDPAYARNMEKRLQALHANKDAPIWNVVDRGNLQRYLQEETPWPWYGQLMRKPQTAAYMLQLDFWLRHYNVRLL